MNNHTAPDQGKRTELAFRRQFAGSYFAKDDTHEYAVHGRRPDHRWTLTVRELTTTAGVRHALGQPVIAEQSFDRKADAVAVARHYSTVTPPPSQSRLTAAMVAWADAAKARVTAYEIERAEQAAIFAQAEEHIAWARRNGHLR